MLSVVARLMRRTYKELKPEVKMSEMLRPCLGSGPASFWRGHINHIPYRQKLKSICYLYTKLGCNDVYLTSAESLYIYCTADPKVIWTLYQNLSVKCFWLDSHLHIEITEISTKCRWSNFGAKTIHGITSDYITLHHIRLSFRPGRDTDF